MYTKWFNLACRPFAATPDTDLVYWSDDYRRAFDRLYENIQTHRGVTVLLGDIGTGKTLLLGLLKRRGDAEGYVIVTIANVGGDALELASRILAALPERARTGSDMDALAELPSALSAIEGTGRLVIAVDEAQGLSEDGMALLAEIARRPGIMLVLVGLPELAGRLSAPQWAGASPDHLARLAVFDLDGTAAYISARLEAAGAPAHGIFEPEAIRAIHRVSRGVPRVINQICDFCLTCAATEQIRRIERGYVEEMCSFWSGTAISGPAPRMARGPATPAPIARARIRDPVERATRPRPVEPEHGGEAIPLPVTPDAGAEEPRPARLSGRLLWLPALAASLAAIVSIPDWNAVPPATTAATVQSPAGAPQPLVGMARSVPTISVPDPVTLAALPLAEPLRDEADKAGEFFLAALALDDPTLAAVAFSRAALRGNARAARYLGQLYEAGDGVSFAPEIANRWYRLAGQGSSPHPEPSVSVTREGDHAMPLFGAHAGKGLDLVWTGSSDGFEIELADPDKTPLARFGTPLTAARIVFPVGAAYWRVRAGDGLPSEWQEIAAAYQAPTPVQQPIAAQMRAR